MKSKAILLAVFLLLTLGAWAAALRADGPAQGGATFAYLPFIRSGRPYWAIAYPAANIAPTSDGGLLVLGSLEDPGGSSARAQVTRLTWEGEIVWEKVFETGGNYESANDGLETPSGEFIVAGNRQFAAWVAKLDGEGSVLWQRTYGEFERDSLTAIAPTNDGGWIAAGWTYEFNNTRPIVLKLAADGTVLWQKILGEYQNELYASARHIQQTASGDYIVAGSADSTLYTPFNWIIRLSATGDIVWQKALSGANAYAATADDGLLVAGNVGPFENLDAWLMKLDNSGAVLWQRRYGAGGLDDALAVAETPYGRILLAGRSNSFGTSAETDAWLLQLADDGSVLSRRIYMGLEMVPTYATAVAGSLDHGAFLAVAGADYGILKMDQFGLIPGCPISESTFGEANAATETLSELDWVVAEWTGVVIDLADAPLDGGSTAGLICPAGG